jgi:hypothetical protein
MQTKAKAKFFIFFKSGKKSAQPKTVRILKFYL